MPRQVPIADGLETLPAELTLASGVTILAGLNGVGKTRLLKLIGSSLGESARLISLHDLCAWLVTLLRDRRDLNEVTEESALLQVDRETLDTVRAIVNRSYGEIGWYAPEVADSPFEPIVNEAVVPYFVVSHNSAAYEMGDMGLGELAAHLLLWILWYLRDHEGLIFLLDEPDAFFPPSSREPLIDYLGSVALTRKQAFVVTTHSRELIERGLMHEHVLGYMQLGSGGVDIYSDRAEVRQVVEEVLYPEDSLQLVCWLEDDAAHAFAVALLNRIDRSLLRHAALYWTGGSGDLEAMRQHMPRPSARVGPLEFLFVWDGDQPVPTEIAARWPGVCLPGGANPDALFKEYAPGSIKALYQSFDVSKAVLDASLHSLDGADPHDWTTELAELSGLGRSQGLRQLAEATLDSNSDLVEEFRQSLVATGLESLAAFD